jgi:protease-4
VRQGGLLVGLVALACALAPGASRAEPPLSPSEPLPSPGKHIATDDDASAVSVNPANLAFVPEPEVRWTWTYTGEYADLPVRGHAFDVASPLWFFGTGLRVELHNPPFGAPPPFSRNYQWVRWGVAGRVDRWLGVGAGFGWSLSDSPRLDDQFGLTLGFTLRPSQYVSWSGLLRDANAPTSRDDETASYRSWETGLALRPLAGKRDVEIGLEGRFYDQLGEGSLRATLGVDVPYVGRFRSDVRLLELDFSDPEVVATAGLDVNFGPMQVSGGALFGNGIGLDDSGFYVGAAFRKYREPGIPFGKRVARIDINDTPGDRGHVNLLRRLWRLATNDEVEGVLLVLKDDPAYSLAHAEELGDAIRLLRAQGARRPSATSRTRAAGALRLRADRSHRHEPGRRAALLRPVVPLFLPRRTARKARREGRFRAHRRRTRAPPSSSRSKASTDVAREDHQDLVEPVREGRPERRRRRPKDPVDDLKRPPREGPVHRARGARGRGLVDVLAYEDELGRVADEVMGRPTRLMRRACP